MGHFNGNDNGDDNDDVNVDGLGLSVEGDSSQTQNDETDDNYKVNGNDDDNGNNKASTKSVLRWGLFGSNVYFCTLFGGIQAFRLF